MKGVKGIIIINLKMSRDQPKSSKRKNNIEINWVPVEVPNLYSTILNFVKVGKKICSELF